MVAAGLAWWCQEVLKCNAGKYSPAQVNVIRHVQKKRELWDSSIFTEFSRIFCRRFFSALGIEVCKATGELEIATWRSKLLDRSREYCPAHQPMIFCGFPCHPPNFTYPKRFQNINRSNTEPCFLFGHIRYMPNMGIRGRLCHQFWDDVGIFVGLMQNCRSHCPSWPVLAAKQLVFLTAKLPEIRDGLMGKSATDPQMDIRCLFEKWWARQHAVDREHPVRPCPRLSRFVEEPLCGSIWIKQRCEFWHAMPIRSYQPIHLDNVERHPVSFSTHE